MATKLDKPLIRETGLDRGGKPVYVVLIPSDTGGTLIFKEKGKHGNGVEISLRKVFEDAVGIEKPVEKKVKEPVESVAGIDLVDLGTLEARLMIDAEDVMTVSVKGRLFEIIREMREERREEVGMAPVQRGVKKGEGSWRKG